MLIMKTYSTSKLKKFRLFWRIVFFIGFIMIIVNAIDYLVGWNKISSAINVTGISFVALGIIFGQMKNK